jgi:hypothetical protein
MNPVPKTTRRIWSEFVSYEVLCSKLVVDMLREHDLEVLVAVTPSQLEDVPKLSKHMRDAGVRLGLWPMVADDHGRWGSTFNAHHFSEFTTAVSEIAPEDTTIAIDLEPPITIMHGLLTGRPRAYRQLLRTNNWGAGHERLHELLRTLKQRGSPCLAAANPMLLGDGRGESAWQWLFGTPIDQLPFDAVSFMTYTSLISGYTKGLLSRPIAQSMLMQTAVAAQRQWGNRASMSLGTVGGGALGDEVPYRSIQELREDVATALACGVTDLALFDLSGVLTKNNPSEWISAFATTEAADTLPRLRRRARIIKSGIKRGGSAIGWYRRLRESSE